MLSGQFEMPETVRQSHDAWQESMKGINEREGMAGDAEIVVRRGHAARDILSFASERKADMIVMASHDPGIVDYFLGSVAGHVVRHAHCSVLVVRPA